MNITNSPVISTIINKLHDPLLVHRQQGIIKLKQFIQQQQEQQQEQSITTELIPSIFILLSSNEWYQRQGGFLAATELLNNNKSIVIDLNQFISTVLNAAIGCITDPEPRVRLAVADTLQSIVSINSVSYKQIHSILINDIRINYNRNYSLPTLNNTEFTDSPAASPNASPNSRYRRLMNRYETDINTSNNNSNNTDNTTTNTNTGASVSVSASATSISLSVSGTNLLHDTAGWKSLESSCIILSHCINGLQYNFNEFINNELIELISNCTIHTNRYVRETGLIIIGQLISIINSIEQQQLYSNQLSTILSIGLSDNWSSVRYAAAVSSRLFLQYIPIDIQLNYYSQLLPPLALNRYYSVAIGVGNYSNETWKLYFSNNGRELCSKYINYIVEYYINQTTAANRSVRESACYCIAELANKLDYSIIQPYVPQLLQSLLQCLNDPNWTVHSSAAIASGIFCSIFNTEVIKLQLFDEFWLLWLRRLESPIESVREDSAIAIGKAVMGFKQLAIDRIKIELKQRILAVKQQSEYDTNTATTVADNTITDIQSRSLSVVPQNRPMFSCDGDTDINRPLIINTNKSISNNNQLSASNPSSLIAKGRGKIDYTYSRSIEPWELTSGSIYLLRELSNQKCLFDITPFITLINDILSIHSYSSHIKLLIQYYTVIPIIANNLTSKPFKRILDEILLDNLFYCLTSNNNSNNNNESILATSTAINCIKYLQSFIGENIFYGRLNEKCKMIVNQLKSNNYNY